MLSIVGILAVPFITKVMSKRNTVILGLILTIIGQLVMYFAHQSIVVLIIGTVISAIGLGFPAGLIFVLMADIVDYGEWKTGIRAQGLLGAVASMGGKFGSGLGGALPAWLLAAGHYVANEKQTATALNMIEISFIWVPIILCIGAIISMMFYKFEKPHAESGASSA
jgi:Na+/melibiose symporter-like transporter